jgi:hypothetical protein
METGAAGKTTAGYSIPTSNPTGSTYSGHHGSPILVANPTGSNMTGSNMTGAAGNTTASNMTGSNATAHSSSIPTTKPAGAPEPDKGGIKVSASHYHWTGVGNPNDLGTHKYVPPTH